ncbi:hypothetical protein J3R83DRAFT_9536 [Lanmaoa asiatica]|nr:hypothetical protein J3R83DRAFT_9536 [Lanmaoa asiatica]
MAEFWVRFSGRVGGTFSSPNSILLWDHILTFPDEVELIWMARLSIPKVLFLLNRYVVPLAMIVQSHVQWYYAVSISCGEHISFRLAGVGLIKFVQFCKLWYAIAVAVGMLSIATSNFLILLRLWVLWDRRPRLMLGTFMFFVVTQIVALSFAGYVIHGMLPTLAFEPLLRVCMPMSKPNFVMLWSPGIAFELMIFLMTMCNALDRPRSRNAQMAKIMYRDGSMYFFVRVLLSRRAERTHMRVIGPICFIWSIANITLARLILNLRRLSSNAGDKAAYGAEPSDDTKEGMEPTELLVLRRKHSEWSEGSVM